MGLFKFLFGEDITQHWQPNSSLELEFDFDTNALSGVRLGERVHRLDGLGPAEDKSEARGGIYCYYSKGLSITTGDEYSIDLVLLVWQFPERPDYQPYTGRCILGRKPLPLTRNTTSAEFREYFGEPEDRDQQEGAILYEKDDVVVDVDFGHDNRLQYIIIGRRDGRKTF